MSAFRIRWFVFALLFGFAFTGYVQRTGVSIAAERMMPELGLTQVQVGWLLTAFLFTSLAAAALWLTIDAGRPATPAGPRRP